MSVGMANAQAISIFSGIIQYIETDQKGRESEWVLQFEGGKATYFNTKAFSKTPSGQISTEFRSRYYTDRAQDMIMSWHSKGLTFPENVLLKEPYPVWDWDFSDKTKQIGEMECVLAITEYKGRKYHAWFTFDIPVPYGPWKLGGLPGLIMEAYDSEKKFHFVCSSVETGTDMFKETPIFPPYDGKEITWEEYVHLHLTAEQRLSDGFKARLIARGLKTDYVKLEFKDELSIENHIEGNAFLAEKKK